MKAVIMAGGKGTRIATVSSAIPKPMIPVLGKPVLEYQTENLKRQGISDIIMVCGHLKEKIAEYFGDGKKFGLNIEYVFENKPLGTAGALSLLKDKLDGDFFLINGDIIFDVDLSGMVAFHRSHNALITILTHPNSHPYDSSLIEADQNGTVVCWHTKEDNRGWLKNSVNAGIHLLSERVFSDSALSLLFSEVRSLDLDRDVLKPLVNTGKLFSYHSSEYVMDMGVPERYNTVSEDIAAGKPQKRNLKNPQKAVFLDRDGTINKYVGFLKNIDDFELIDNVAKAINLIHSKGFLAVVITNQPVVARGEVTFEQLETIHNKMETLLGREGAYIDGIYYCPHHPDKGFEGEIPELKIKCDCRKPKIGLVEKAKSELNIDLASSWFVGDSETDILTGKNAGCKTALLSSDESGKNIYPSLYDFAVNLEENE